MSHTCVCGNATIVGNDKRAGETHRHGWTEDGATFTVEEVPSSTMPKLIGEHFHDTWGCTGNEAVLAREILRQSELIESLQIRARQNLDQHRASYRDVLDELASACKEKTDVESENLKLTDRLNALTARIEEALDLLIHETEGSRRVEQTYRMLEKVMMDNTKGEGK